MTKQLLFISNSEKERIAFMSRTKKIRLLLKIVAFCLCFGIVLCYTSVLLKDKNNYLKYARFYKEKETFDVLFFGSSRILDAAYPMELWEDYHIMSYNMAQHGEHLRTSYWQMENAFRVNKPKVAVVDLSLNSDAAIGADDEESLSYLHKSVDHIPLSYFKYRALKDITDQDVDISEYLFPLVIYHNRWDRLEENDFYRRDSANLGAEKRIGVERFEESSWSNDALPENPGEGTKYFRKIIALCEKENVSLVFTVMPSLYITCNPDVCAGVNYMEEYARERGIPFLNFAKRSGIINYGTDFYDISHVNPSGAMKITDYIGKELSGRYGISDKKPETIREWDDMLSAYQSNKIAMLNNEKAANNVINYLMLLNDDRFEYAIELFSPDYVETAGLETILAELGASFTEKEAGRKLYYSKGLERLFPEEADPANAEDASLAVWVYDADDENLLDTAYFY